MRNLDRLPFILAGVLFLLAWLLGFPMRAQSAPFWDVRCSQIADVASGKRLSACVQDWSTRGVPEDLRLFVK